jgi:hypothetical protein
MRVVRLAAAAAAAEGDIIIVAEDQVYTLVSGGARNPPFKTTCQTNRAAAPLGLEQLV